jgi:hypothetical protein
VFDRLNWLLIFPAAFAAPTAGAMAGYYTPLLKPYLPVSPRAWWFKWLIVVVCTASRGYRAGGLVVGDNLDESK